MPEIQLFAVDVDGCLLAEDFRQIDLSAFQKLRDYCLRVEAEGLPPLVLCTGRPQPFALALLKLLGAVWPGMPSVIEHGAFLYYPYEDVLEPNPLLPPDLSAWEAVRAEAGRLARRHGARLEPGDEVCLSLYPPAGLPVEQLFSAISPALSGHPLAQVTHSSLTVDIMPEGLTKKTGLAHLAARTGIDLKQVVAIGDSMNDLPMLTAVGYPACPANAIPAVRQAASYCSRYPHVQGVWDIITYFGK